MRVATAPDTRASGPETLDPDEILAGLARRPKRLPCKLLYDAEGARLFERICAQPEYYLRRAELEILDAHGADIARTLGPHVLLIEYGSGSSAKTGPLLERLPQPAGYVPVDLCAPALDEAVERLSRAHPGLPITPLHRDFSAPLEPWLPRPATPHRRVIYFPGSTLGNFDDADATALLRKMHAELGEQGGALIGVDLKKDVALLEAAYNDRAGITARFTLNLLARLNRELDADFDLSAFRHRAVYDARAGRIDTHLVSLRRQAVRVAGHAFTFAAAEAMQVEHSCKYSFVDFARLARRARLRIAASWGDAAQRFAMHYLVRAARAAPSP